MFFRRCNTAVLFVAGASLFCQAETKPGSLDLTGRWLHEAVSADGHRSQMVPVFEQDGQKLNGRVIFAWGEIQIQSGAVEGDTFHFAAITPADSEKPATYDGALKGGVLEVHSHWPGNNNTEFTATHTGDTTGTTPTQ